MAWNAHCLRVRRGRETVTRHGAMLTDLGNAFRHVCFHSWYGLLAAVQSLILTLQSHFLVSKTVNANPDTSPNVEMSRLRLG